jgi:subtilase family serine protease
MRGDDRPETDAKYRTGGILMKRAYLSERSPERISLGIVFILLAFAFAPCVSARLALAAENEPMVPLSGKGLPQSLELPTTTTPAPPEMVLHLRIYLDIRDKEAARKLTEDQQNASSPSYRKWLKTGQFDEMFGPLQASYDAIAAWLTSQGFIVTAVRRDRRDIEFTGTVAQADQAFQVQIMNMSDGQRYRATSLPMIPARFQGVIFGVIGLDNLLTTSPQTTIGGTTEFGPQDFYTFYDENALLAAGINGNIPGQPSECLAIVGLSDYLPAAITTFDTQFLLSGPSITKRLADTTNPGPTYDRNEIEAELDLEWGHAAAPGAPLTFYLGNQTVSLSALLDAFLLAATDNTCGTISVSFAICYDPGGFFAYGWDLVAMQAAMQGQSVFVSSGDFGSASQAKSGNMCVAGTTQGVNTISASTYVTSVGGTQFNPGYSLGSNQMDVGFVPEGVWDVLTAGASGGGPAVESFDKPNYQATRTPPDGWRDVPDVALMAAGNLPGAFFGDDPLIKGSPCPGPGACIAFGGSGTSLATVLWAGISKLIQQQLGTRIANINPELYSLAELGPTAGLRDVTGTATPSDNGFNNVLGWRAEDGYDLATGWGTPDIATLVNLFASSKVVLIGGEAGTGNGGIGKNIQTAEAYNPVTQTFSSLGTVMSAKRVLYGAAKLPDGRFLLAGGDNSSIILTTADIFDPVTDTFAQTTHGMHNPYFDFAQAVALDTGQVFIIGTDTTGNGKLWTEIYDPPTQTFTTPVKILGSNEPEVGYTSTLLGNSKVSGQVLIQGYTSTAELYDPIAKTFNQTATQPPKVQIPGGQLETLYSPAAVLLANGMVLFAGGLAGSVYPSSFAYLYNPATNTFAPTGSLNQARCYPSAVALPNGEAMVYGPAAQNNVAGSCVFDPTVEIYNPGTGTFTEAQMTTTRGYPFVSVIPNSANNLTAQVLIAGGFISSGILDTAEVYDPTFGTFTALTMTMTTPTEGGAGYAFPAR